MRTDAHSHPTITHAPMRRRFLASGKRQFVDDLRVSCVTQVHFTSGKAVPSGHCARMQISAWVMVLRSEF
ncbi:hypothetical protein AOQ72_16155 [Bradyrhizobium yuanmingense]|uniref:Uncharacterized protein n=1 Tax=Bradyrhizobium yuanmingense TaxID=108015 RepID=A0A0R3CUL6_9BRAD|nr:hypothetical protein [Bradyrhizobium yuanmingense]KRP98852.1 hypothetical protein AOQ72_16155 [Bradyrhizobium yuanmingense]